MVPRTLSALLVAALLALAGCADESQAPEEDDDGFSDDLDDELQATDDTGIIRGVIVSESIVPVPGVTVTIASSGQETTSNDDGQFGFADLAPGTYFLDVAKPGWTSSRTSVEVVAGVDDPPVVRILIQENPSTRPSYELLTFTGFLDCGAGLSGVGAVNPCAVIDIVEEETGGDPQGNGVTFPVPDVPDFLQAELVWESTSTLGTSLYLGFEDPQSLTNGDFAGGEGESPVVVRVDKETLLAGLAGDTNITMTIFPGSDQPATAHIQQEFQLFVTYYYNWEPAADFTVAEQGEPVPPS